MRNSPVTRDELDVLQRTIEDLRREVLLLKNQHSPTVPVYLPDVPDDQIDGQVALVPFAEALDGSDATVKPAWSFGDVWRPFVPPNDEWYALKQVTLLGGTGTGAVTGEGGRLYKFTQWDTDAGDEEFDNSIGVFWTPITSEPDIPTFPTGTYMFTILIRAVFPQQTGQRDAGISLGAYQSTGAVAPSPPVDCAWTDLFDMTTDPVDTGGPITREFMRTFFATSSGSLGLQIKFVEDDLAAARTGSTLSTDQTLHLFAHRMRDAT